MLHLGDLTTMIKSKSKHFGKTFVFELFCGQQTNRHTDGTERSTLPFVILWFYSVGVGRTTV